jgi:hypothetical protein
VPIFKFKKTQRLLNASDYKQVFDDNRVKVANSSLLILAKPADGYPSRLGLVIAKKIFPQQYSAIELKGLLEKHLEKTNFKFHWISFFWHDRVQTNFQLKN